MSDKQPGAPARPGMLGSSSSGFRQADRPAPSPLPPALRARLMEAVGHHQRGDPAKAERVYRETLAAAPDCFDAMHLLGVALTQRGAFDEGIARIRRAIVLDETQPNARSSLARALLQQGDAAAALAACEALAAMQPKNAEAWFLRGNAMQLGGAHDAAVKSYDEALRLQPNFPAALNNQGHSLRTLRRGDQALAAFGRALELQPAYAMALNNQGLALLDLLRVPEALRSFDRALALQPSFLEVLNNRGTALLAARRFAEASESFGRLTALAPDFGGAWGNLLYARRNCCDWHEYENLARRIIGAVERGEFADAPLSFMCVADSSKAQFACARTFTAMRYPPRFSPEYPERYPGEFAAETSAPRPPDKNDRIRVAYLSGDFGEHAVSYLLAGVIERHDASRFDTIAVSWGRRNDGPTRARLESAFARFIDATDLSDTQVANLLRSLKVDIAIDLMGHTSGQRTGIFAERCAPLQVNYLGFPGTTGAPYMDYLIADSVVVPPCDEAAYSECVIHLPHCFLPNDDGRTVATLPFTRAEAGLPADAFVFCAFNNVLKITPDLFGVWMGILRELPNAILWLRAGAPEARANLEHAAERSGVDRSRLVFAAAIPSMELHLARHRLADLFLDTLPYNGHSTACDALWAGLPVLTCRGGSFAGRVGASLLESVGIPELIAENLETYAALALALARDAVRLAELRERLAQHRKTSPLFDTPRYCRDLESAFSVMMERYRHGLPPAAFKVAPVNAGSANWRGRILQER